MPECEGAGGSKEGRPAFSPGPHGVLIVNPFSFTESDKSFFLFWRRQTVRVEGGARSIGFHIALLWDEMESSMHGNGS